MFGWNLPGAEPSSVEPSSASSSDWAFCTSGTTGGSGSGTIGGAGAGSSCGGNGAPGGGGGGGSV